MNSELQTMASGPQRRVRIELLRLQARYQRLALARSSQALSELLTPAALMAQARHHWKIDGSGPGVWRYARAALRLVRRYPMTLSVLSSVVSVVRKRSAVGVGLGALMWWIATRARREPPGAEDSQATDGG